MREKMKTRIPQILMGTWILCMLILLFPATTLHAANYEAAGKEEFISRMNNAQNGDVITLTSDISLGTDDKGFVIKADKCFVTLNLNGHTIKAQPNDKFGVNSNSALLILNGNIEELDTNNEANGTIILSGVNVTSRMFLGNTIVYIVNDSYVENLFRENGAVNPGTNLNDLPNEHFGISKGGTEEIGVVKKYNYENPAPALVGSANTWVVLESLQNDFEKAGTDVVYKNIVLLRDYNMSVDASLLAADKRVNLSGYTLNTNGKSLSISNTSGTDFVENGTIDGNISANGNGGQVVFPDLTCTGKVQVSNGSFLTIQGGKYEGNISCDDASKISITEGGFSGNLMGDNYEISGGKYKYEVKTSWLKAGYDVYPCEDPEYNYEVTPHNRCHVAKETGKAPTCVDYGWKDYYRCTLESCGKCYADEAMTQEIKDLDLWKAGDGRLEKIDHTWDAGVVTKKATTQEEGERTYTCTFCKTTKVEKIAKAHFDRYAINKKFSMKRASGKCTVTWTPVEGAKGYDIYMEYCNGREDLVKNLVKSVKANVTKVTIKKIKGKKINNKKALKCRVVAYKYVNGKKVVLTQTVGGHKSGKTDAGKTDAKTIRIKNTKVILQPNQTSMINAKTVKAKKSAKYLKHIKEIRYYSGDSSVATVTSKGKILAKGTGNCTVYVIAENGLTKTINVTVK